MPDKLHTISLGNIEMPCPLRHVSGRMFQPPDRCVVMVGISPSRLQDRFHCRKGPQPCDESSSSLPSWYSITTKFRVLLKKFARFVELVRSLALPSLSPSLAIWAAVAAADSLAKIFSPAVFSPLCC